MFPLVHVFAFLVLLDASFMDDDDWDVVLVPPALVGIEDDGVGCEAGDCSDILVHGPREIVEFVPKPKAKAKAIPRCRWQKGSLPARQSQNHDQ